MNMTDLTDIAETIYLWHYAPLINRIPKLGEAIHSWVTERGIVKPADIEEKVQDYIQRNGIPPMVNLWFPKETDDAVTQRPELEDGGD